MGRVVAPLAPAQEQLKTRPLSVKTHILLVEDDVGVRDATRLLLKVEGYRVTPVGSLADATSTANADRSIDLILTDYHLGSGQTGTQVIATLREVLGKPVKAILMTGDTSSAIRELPIESGVKVASKPIKAEELLILIKGLLVD
jgi:two-component system, sensor histidine kinase